MSGTRFARERAGNDAGDKRGILIGQLPSHIFQPGTQCTRSFHSAAEIVPQGNPCNNSVLCWLDTFQICNLDTLIELLLPQLFQPGTQRTCSFHSATEIVPDRNACNNPVLFRLDIVRIRNLDTLFGRCLHPISRPCPYHTFCNVFR